MIPSEAFDPLLQELERQPLVLNRYRKGAGLGRSQSFGVVNRRCMPVDYSRQCWRRPYLYKLLLDFAAEYVDISWNAITVNQNYQSKPHRDQGNLGNSFLVAFGDYEGGALKIWEGDLSGVHDICHKPIVTDFSKVLHSVEDFTGNRFSLVYYWCSKTPAGLPASSVEQINGVWKFKRGDVVIERKTGLPHPLRNRIKNRH